MNSSSSCLRPKVMAAFIIASLFLVLSPFSQIDVSASKGEPEFWRIAPSAPKIAESDRLTELRNRRQEVMKRMGNRALMVLFSAEPRVYTNDTDYHYRQENNLYYLTGIKQEGEVLVLIPGARSTREILFMPERNPFLETWTGRMMSFNEASDRSGIQEVWDTRRMGRFLAFLAPRAEAAIGKTSAISKPDGKIGEQWQEDFQPVIEAIASDHGEIYILNSATRDLREFHREREF